MHCHLMLLQCAKFLTMQLTCVIVWTSCVGEKLATMRPAAVAMRGCVAYDVNIVSHKKRENLFLSVTLSKINGF